LYVPQGGIYKLLPVISTVEIEYGDGDDDDDDEDFEADAGDDLEGIVGEDIQFNGSAWGGDEPYSWHWDFGDGNTSTDRNTTHNYTLADEYEVVLTVTDDDGDIATDEIEVKITEE
jgi:PKD repeat protein